MRLRTLTSALALAALAAGCASTGNDTTTNGAPPTPASQYGHVLTRPDLLKPMPDDAGLVWKDPSVDFAAYKAFMIERVRVQLDPNSASVDPNDLAVLTDYFGKAIAKAISPPYTLVDKPAPGVLRVRITLVGIRATNTAMSVVVLLTPYATLPDMVSGSVDGRPAGSAPYLGSTSIAVQLIDGGTGKVVGEYADTRFGRKYVLDTASVSTAVTAGATNYLDSYSEWAYAKQAFDQWAALFRARVDAIKAAGGK